MKILSLYLRNFRNYEKVHLSFSSSVNYLVGANAQGKTNLLEAIHLAITGRSFRTHRLTDMIRFGEKEFFVEILFEKNGIEQKLSLYYDGQTRRITHNATLLPSLSALFGLLQGVILSPEDQQLVGGGPTERRRFLDMQIAQSYPLYFHHLVRYQRAMKHRNTLLKRKTLQGIEVYEEEMSHSAAYLTLKRKEATEELQTLGGPLQQALSGNRDELTLTYHSSALAKVKPEESCLRTYFQNAYTQKRHREKELGNTLTGPHRDDLAILVANQEARFFGSEGQKRSCITALRLAEWSRLHKLGEEKPLMCIDDVGISLDATRGAYLYQQMESLGQVFLTSPRLEQNLPSHTHVLHVSEGDIL
ncbi:MAG: DNA replication and repair protein RecF [Chlamydiae bacterium]|nr:DNA replication and repair protein RecF [Chlamydiota bacterium]